MGGAGRIAQLKVGQLLRGLVMSSPEMIHTIVLLRATNVIMTMIYTHGYTTVIKRDGGD